MSGAYSTPVLYLISRGDVCDDGVAVAAREPRDPLPAALAVVGYVVGGQPVLGHLPPERVQLFGCVGSVWRGHSPIAAVGGDVARLAAYDQNNANFLFQSY